MQHLLKVPPWMVETVLAASCFLWLARPVEASLIAHYEAEGNVNDSAGSHHGSLVNGAGFGAGQFGQAFDLNGSTQYASAPDSADWAFGNSPFTISVWANLDSIRSGGLGALPNVFVGQDEGSGSQDKWIFYHDGNGNLAFHINSDGGNVRFFSAPTPFSPSVGVWNMYTLTRSGTTFNFYANGISLGGVTTSVINSFIADATAPLTIGQAENLGFLNGRIDDVRIYNTALTQSEVADLMNPPAAIPEPAGTLLTILGGFGFAAGARRQRLGS